MLENTPGLRELVAEFYAAGFNNREMLEELPISDPVTLRKWLKDDGVQQIVQNIMGERAVRVRRKIDTEIDARLSNPKRLRDMPVDSLLKIRKEYAPEVIHQAGEEAHEVMSRLYRAARKNPELANALNALNFDDPDAPVAATSEEITPEGHNPAINVEEAVAEALKNREKPAPAENYAGADALDV